MIYNREQFGWLVGSMSLPAGTLAVNTYKRGGVRHFEAAVREHVKSTRWKPIVCTELRGSPREVGYLEEWEDEYAMIDYVLTPDEEDLIEEVMLAHIKAPFMDDDSIWAMIVEIEKAIRARWELQRRDDRNTVLRPDKTWPIWV